MAMKYLGSVLFTVALLFWSIYVLPYVQNRSTSLGLDFAMIIGWTVLVIGASFVEASIFFPQKEQRELDIKEISGSFRTTILKSALIVLFIVLNFGWSEFVSGGFWFKYYSKAGSYITAMRSHDPSDNLWALNRTVQLVDPEVYAMVAPGVDRLAHSKNKKVAARAILWIGYIGNELQSYEVSKVPQEVKEVAKKALNILSRYFDDVDYALNSKSPELKMAGAWAAGWLRDEDRLGTLSQIIETSHNPEVIKAAVFAVTMIGGVRALRILGTYLFRSDKIVRVYFAWGYVNVAAEAPDGLIDANSKLFKDMEQKVAKGLINLDLGPRCAFLQGFGRLGDAVFTDSFLKLVDTCNESDVCPRIELKPAFGRPIVVSSDGKYYVYLTNAIAAIAKGNYPLIKGLQKRLQHLKGDFARMLKEVVRDAQKQ